MEKLLFRNRIFLDRLRGRRRPDARTTRSRSRCTGPIARASGVTYDLRKDEPYLAYPDFDFDVPYTTEGDCYARFLVRMEEMRQSVRIIEQAVENLPGGPGQRADRREVPAARQGDGLQQHGGPDPALRADHAQPRASSRPVDEVYAAVESPNGELGYYLVADGSQTAWRTRTRPPSFIHFQVFPHIIKDHLIADIVAVLGSLNIIAAELDR